MGDACAPTEIYEGGDATERCACACVCIACFLGMLKDACVAICARERVGACDPAAPLVKGENGRRAKAPKRHRKRSPGHFQQHTRWKGAEIKTAAREREEYGAGFSVQRSFYFQRGISLTGGVTENSRQFLSRCGPSRWCLHFEHFPHFPPRERTLSKPRSAQRSILRIDSQAARKSPFRCARLCKCTQL